MSKVGIKVTAITHDFCECEDADHFIGDDVGRTELRAHAYGRATPTMRGRMQGDICAECEAHDLAAFALWG